jgi:membrane-associated HD superfamily phosphohydrolase
MPNKPRSPVIQSSTKSAKEAKAKFLADAQQRLEDDYKVLTSTDLSGDYDKVLKDLFTTMGGQLRPITNDDLQAFRQRQNEVKKKHSPRGRFRGGIRIDQVIDMSAAIDRERARKQIRTAIPVSMKGGVIHLQTNASSGSTDTRHHVYVELLDFTAWIASPQDPKKVADKLIKSSPIKYDCDCGRHRYWYRYIASIGGFAYGRLEDGYPKIKNPKLYGVACKHTLRVMALFKSPTMKQYLIREIERNRKQLTPRQKGMNPKEQEKFLKQVQAESSRYKGIAVSAKERRKQLLKRNTPESKKVAKEIDKANDKLIKEAEKKGAEKTIKRELRKLEKNLKLAQMTESAIKNILKATETSMRKELK